MAEISTAHPALTVFIALAAGVIAQTLARHIRTPGIITLLLMGVILGPDVLHWIDPDSLGNSMQILIGVAVAVILFEGGLHLELRRLRREAKTIRRLVTIGALLTAIGSGFGAHFMMGLNWQLSILFGALVIVTGPTVVTPLLRRLHVNRNLQTVLEAEGVLIDPIGAIIAVFSLEVVISAATSSVAWGMVDLFLRLGFGTAAGLAGGYIIGQLLRWEKIVPNELENIFTLTLVLLLFEMSNIFLEESGIMTVTVAGMVVGNMKIPTERRLIEFKEQLTTMLIGMLFVLLAADVRLSDVQTLGKPGLYTVLVVMLVVRPLNVAACTLGSELSWRDRLFMSWLAPRGIVAAAVASLFALQLDEAGISGGNELRALVFLVIAMTVVLQGLTAGLFGSLLGVRLKRDDGYIIVGANPIGRLLAKIIRGFNQEVIVIDTNPAECHMAQQEGAKVIYGNALEERILIRADVSSRIGVICLTPNEGLNVMLARRVHTLEKEKEVYVALNRGTQVTPEVLKQETTHVIFGTETDFDLWVHRLRNDNAKVEAWSYQGERNAIRETWLKPGYVGPDENTILPLAIARAKEITPFYGSYTIRKNDILYFLCFRERLEEIHQWLTAQKCTPGIEATSK